MIHKMRGVTLGKQWARVLTRRSSKRHLLEWADCGERRHNRNDLRKGLDGDKK